MSEACRTGSDSLPLSQARRLDEVLHRFEDVWRAGSRPAIEDYLRDIPEPERADLLRELIAVEVYYRRLGGDDPQPADYQERFPAPGPTWLAQEVAGRAASTADPSTLAAERAPSAGSGEEIVVAQGQINPLGTLPWLQRESEDLRPEPIVARLPSIPGYEILGELGRGGMGVVYKARQLGLGRLVAIKMILGSAPVARFRREAEAVAQLQHPHIVQIYEIGEQDGLPYFSLEFLDGGNLAQKLAQTPVSPRQAAQLVETLAGAVHAAHERGIIHRDLKPANVLLTTDGVPKISDFGLAKRLDAEADLTQSGEIMGTPSYMAPEQAGAKRKQIGPACDVYALGAILYELLTGEPPFRGATALDTVMQVLSEDPIPPCRLRPKLPRDLEAICLKCLEKRPQRRYASAQALANDLHCFLCRQPVRARAAGLLATTQYWVRRNPVWAIVIVTVALGTAWWVAESFSALHRLERHLHQPRQQQHQQREEELRKD